MPAAGVVIAAYNASRTLATTLESVRTQTVVDIEVVVVDDGSTDTTFEIARSFAARDDRFKVVRQQNAGVADARNRGIAEVRAPLVAVLDADDIWHPTFLQKVVDALHRAGSDTILAYANARVIDLAGNVLYNAPSYDQAGWVLSQLLLTNFIGNGSAVVFRRDIAARIGGYDRRLQHEFGAQGAEDWLLALRLSARGRVAAVREFLVGYRSVPDAMSANTLRMRRSRLHAVELLYADVEPPANPAARWALGIAHAKCFLHEIRAWRLADAFRSLVQALRFDPFGTCQLLFGAERWQWLRRAFAKSDPNQSRPFDDFDPREGREEHVSTRLARASQWDAQAGRPIVRVAPTSIRQST